MDSFQIFGLWHFYQHSVSSVVQFMPVPSNLNNMGDSYSGIDIFNNLPMEINPLNTELNPICHLLALLGAHHFLHVSRIRVKNVAYKPKRFKLLCNNFCTLIHFVHWKNVLTI